MDNSRQSGKNGTFVINDTSEHTVNFDTMQISEDTIITLLEIDGVDVLSTYISTPASTIKQTIMTIAASDLCFTKIQLSQGQVTCGLFIK
jgi:hypothetical protein